MFSSSLTILTTQVFQSSFLSILVMQFRPERFSFFIDRTWLGCLPALPGDGASLRLADRPCGTWYAVDATNLSPLDVIDDMHAHRCTSTIHINTRYWMWNYVKWCEMMWMHEDSMKTCLFQWRDPCDCFHCFEMRRQREARRPMSIYSRQCWPQSNTEGFEVCLDNIIPWE